MSMAITGLGYEDKQLVLKMVQEGKFARECEVDYDRAYPGTYGDDEIERHKHDIERLKEIERALIADLHA